MSQEEEKNKNEAVVDAPTTEQQQPSGEENKEIVNQGTEQPKSGFEIPEQYKDRFSTPEEIFSFIEEATKEKEDTRPEVIKRLESLAAEKELNEQLIQFAFKDFDRYNTEEIKDATQLITEGLRIEKPNWSEQRIKDYIESNYDFDSFDEDDKLSKDYKRLIFKMSSEAEKYQELLKSKQDSLGLKGSGMTAKDLELKKTQAEEQARNSEIMKKQIESVVESVKVIPLQVGDEVFDFSIDEQDAKSAKKRLQNPDKFFSPYFNEKGGLEVERLYSDLIKGASFDRAVKVAVDQAIAKAKKDQVANQSNVDLKGVKAPNTSAKTVEGRIVGFGGKTFDAAAVQEFKNNFIKK